MSFGDLFVLFMYFENRGKQTFLLFYTNYLAIVNLISLHKWIV